ncbi:MAG TPA: PAS domain S-box protein, partial [Anaeromyxobacter sp.]|nr:PAS domain S-box protein [Anaeromyxobacter sp.]
PPFSALDLISCRNVLIYLEPDLQKKVIPLFHYALRRGGHLVLGPAEGLVHHPDLFAAVDAKHRIYRRVEAVARPVEFALLPRGAVRALEPPAPEPTPQQRTTAAIERMLVDEYAPPCLVVNGRGDIQFMAGRAGRFLAPPAGAPPTNVLDAVRDSLRVEVRGALRTAAERGARVVRDGVPVELEDGVRRVRLTVRPVPGAEGLFAIVLQDRGAEEVAAGAPAITPVPAALEQIEAELRTTRADLKSAIEGAEAANEELRSANEELVSTNEELQSANEELQTSKEELQSLNEELETVNAELRRSVEDLATANADLQNLFASTEIATLFLDGDLRIARFTPAATALFRLIPGDVGRPISDLAPRFEGNDLAGDAGDVLATGKPTERQVRSADGSSWFILRVLPYRSAANEVVGVVVTFVDVTELKRAEARLTYVATFPEKNPNPIVEADADGRVLYVNPAALLLFPDIRERGVAHPWLAGWEEVARAIRERTAPGARAVTVGERTYHQVLVFVPEERVVRTYGTDITDRVRAEAERERLLAEVQLRAAELDATFSSIVNGVVVYGRDGKIARMNRRAEQLLGFTQREFIALGDLRARAGRVTVERPDGRPFRLEDTPTYRALHGETSLDVQMVLHLPPGRTTTVLASAAPILGPGDEIVGAVATFADLTELRRAQEAVLESEQKYSAIHDHAPFAIALTAPDGTLASVNDAFTRLFGYQRDEVVGRSSVDLGIADPASRGRVEAAFKERGAVRDLEVVRRTRSGEPRVVSLNIEPVVIRGRTFTLTTSQDVTERKRAEDALERSREGLSRLAEASLRVVRETDLGGMLQAVSEAALALTGARLATAGHGYVGGRFLVGGSARALDAPACPPGDMFEVRKGGVHLDLADGAEAIRLDDAALRAHPRWWGLPLEHVPMRGLLGVRMVGRNGQTSGMILVTDKAGGEFGEEDESLLRQLATIASLALQHVEARISLEAADRSKNDFLAMLSHELRNPLAPIRNSLYILDRVAPGGEQARKAHAVIERQTGHLTRLVDDLLDVTRISRGKIQLQLERLDVGEVVRRAADDHRASFANGGVELQVSAPDAPLFAQGDRTRLTQIVGNLLENALKFTPRGGTTSIALEENGVLRQAVLRVRDTGAGIAPDMLPRLFQPFTQADTTLDRSKGGLGLGLALVRGLIEMHGGTVTAESPGLGKGTELTVRLPLGGAGAPATPPPRSVAGPGRRRVLVIEDNVDAAESLRDALVLGGHAVDVAFSGAEGLSKARGFSPDVVFCDIGLPGMDGYEVARAIRTDEALRAVRLVALTGYAGPDDVARAKASGFDAHVPKPPTLEALEQSMSS